MSRARTCWSACSETVEKLIRSPTTMAIVMGVLIAVVDRCSVRAGFLVISAGRNSSRWLPTWTWSPPLIGTPTARSIRTPLSLTPLLEVSTTRARDSWGSTRNSRWLRETARSLVSRIRCASATPEHSRPTKSLSNWGRARSSGAPGSRTTYPNGSPSSVVFVSSLIGSEPTDRSELQSPAVRADELADIPERGPGEADCEHRRSSPFGPSGWTTLATVDEREEIGNKREVSSPPAAGHVGGLRGHSAAAGCRVPPTEGLVESDSTLGLALPGYEIGTELGRGAFGVVIAGRHRQLGRDVAIKQLSPGLIKSDSVRSRFLV